MNLIKIHLTFTLAVLTTSACVGVHARPYDNEAQCWGAEQEVSSEMRIFGGCDETVVVTQKDGQYWMFSDGCVPSGYKKVNNVFDSNFCE